MVVLLNRIIAGLWLAVFLSACHIKPLMPVGERGAGLRQPESEYREVQAGDTLYSIAWDSGRDYKEVAAWNHIRSPYTIVPGQKLRLYPPEVETERQGQQKTPPASSPPGASTSSTESSARRVAPVEKSGSVPKSATPKYGYWAWPTEGSLLDQYAANGPNKGIDIGGKKGQPILAAETGQVVYQGSGLRGYGQLIIIKHNADFLSAYAHCDKIYVKEGSVIKRGQKIAAMGNSGVDKVKLHFEIRYRGAPVDPLNYLPKK
jgi:lipoprotein NlpD